MGTIVRISNPKAIARITRINVFRCGHGYPRAMNMRVDELEQNIRRGWQKRDKNIYAVYLPNLCLACLRVLFKRGGTKNE